MSRRNRMIKGSMSDFTAKYRIYAIDHRTPEESKRLKDLYLAKIARIHNTIIKASTMQQLETIKPELLNNFCEWGYTSQDLENLRADWKQRKLELNQ